MGDCPVTGHPECEGSILPAFPATFKALPSIVQNAAELRGMSAIDHAAGG